MFENLINQFATTSLGEELYTISFTAFLLGGGLCCLLRTCEPAQLLPAPPALNTRKRGDNRKAKPVKRKPATRRTTAPRLRATPVAPPGSRAAA